MIEQSKFMIVWRPYFNGRLARGVEDEIRHRNDLIDYGGRKDIPCYVFSPPKDLGQYRIEMFIKRLIGDLKDQKKQPGELRRADRTLCTKEDEQRLREVLSNPSIHNKLASGQITAEEITLAFDPGLKYTFVGIPESSAVGGEREPEVRMRTITRWESLVNEAKVADPVKKELLRGRAQGGRDEVYEYESSPDEFVRWVEAKVDEALSQQGQTKAVAEA